MNAYLKDMNLGVHAADLRRIEVLAQSLPCRSGAQLAVNITVRSVLTAAGDARPCAADEDGVIADGARRDKEEAYPELLAARRCALVVVALETGGRWSAEAAAFIEDLAYARARDAPAALRSAAAAAWQRRWVRMLATACANAFARSLVAPVSDLGAAAVDGPAPSVADLLGPDGAGSLAPGRQPLRG